MSLGNIQTQNRPAEIELWQSEKITNLYSLTAQYLITQNNRSLTIFYHQRSILSVILSHINTASICRLAVISCLVSKFHAGLKLIII